ncbi:Flp pilus assembly protein TadG [Rhizobium sp. RU20A]|uniref:vWA domain-containing protein n=1 Tax=Rhizobium sp. RU20A TaxID=1907412 RepID=UPI000955B321|nr:VWA domain-containing protein [Rhizobium sp. RU20A]SIR01492.1 Flp pilus assembly protein TadG [Rhizobium sp. RU20A]
MTRRRHFNPRGLLSNRSGNFGLLGALALPVLIGAGGIVLDMASMVLTKQEMQGAVDAAALAGASALAGKGVSEDEARKIVLEYLKGQVSRKSNLDEGENDGTPEQIASQAVVKISVKPTLGNAKEYKVEVTAGTTVHFTPLTRLLGHDSTVINSTGTATSSTESKNALSMYLVLDRSGSMDEKTNTRTTRTYTYNCFNNQWVPTTCTWSYEDTATKLEVLKDAVGKLVLTLNEADPTQSLVRTGASSYSTDADQPTPLDWGTKRTMDYVNNLKASGFTNSAPAFVTAYDSLMKLSENNAHKIKNGQIPSKFIVLLTDGVNNILSADTTTKAYCDKARKAGIEVFSVPFMAPKAGQDLLRYCATTPAHYIPAEDGDQLTAAFKFIGERATAVATRLSK